MCALGSHMSPKQAGAATWSRRDPMQDRGNHMMRPWADAMYDGGTRLQRRQAATAGVG